MPHAGEPQVAVLGLRLQALDLGAQAVDLTVQALHLGAVTGGHAASSSKPWRVMTPQTCLRPRRLAHQPSSRHATVICR